MSWLPKLNDRQLAVLRRIGDGDAPVTSAAHELARTVYALRSRRLVDTPRRDGVWTAVITDAGRFYLQHGRYADRGASPTRRPGTSPDPQPVRSAVAAVPDVPGPGELIDKVRAAGGVVRVASPDAVTRAAWRRAIHAAKEKGLVPDGYHLRHRGRDDDDLVVELVGGDHPGRRYWAQERQRLAIPDTLIEPHPVVVVLRREERRLAVSSTSRDRALRLIQALVSAAEQDGDTVALPDTDDLPGFCVVVGRWSYRLVMEEEWDTVERLPDPDAEHDGKVYAWQRVQPVAESAPSGRLRLSLPDDPYGHRGRPRRWADRQRWRLDDKLPDILGEIRTRAKVDEDQHAARERAEADRRRQWEQAVAHAKQRFAEDQRVEALTGQLADWQRAAAARAYAQVLRASIAAEPDPERAADVAAWAEWITGYADRIDPTRRHRLLPAPPTDPTAEQLRPYLKGWSPHGPEQTYGR